MATLEVKLEAVYGSGCMGGCLGSKETVDIEVTDKELEMLRKIGGGCVTCKKVLEAIGSGEVALQPIHEKIEAAFYNMVEEYWLFEAYNECLEENLSAAIENDIKAGEYTPIPFNDFVEKLKSGDIDYDGLEFGYFDDLDDEYDFEDEEDLEHKYSGYILNGYYDWVKEHDHEFVAERVGIDLYSCLEDEVDYTIYLDEQPA